MTKQNLKKSKSPAINSKPRFFKRSSLIKGATLPKAIQFPKIYRIITDPPLLTIRLFNSIRIRLMERFWRAGPLISEQKKASSKQKIKFGFLKWLVKAEAFWVGIVMGIVIIGILVVGLDLNKNIAEKESIDTEKGKILSEIKKWEDITKKYKGYRDGYFKLALLEYKMGNVEESRKYLNEVIRLDPNFEKAREFEKILTR